VEKLVEAADYRNRIGDLVLPQQARTRLEGAEIHTLHESVI
jgi:hypothetical protein